LSSKIAESTFGCFSFIQYDNLIFSRLLNISALHKGDSMLTLTTMQLALFVVAYFAIFAGISYKFTNGFDKSKVGFLVANRDAGLFESSLAAGASWVLGMALFAASGFGYNMGWTGLFWFVVPQTVGMFIFAWFSVVCNRRIPNGYTLSGYIQETYGKSVSTIYQIVLSLISLGFISLTFTALTKYLTVMGIANVPVITGLVVLGTLIYALKGGLKTNLVTGSIQMLFMLVFCAIILGTGLSNGGWEHLVAGINGKANYTDLFDWKLLSTFGIVMALTSVTGIVGNQSYYQKSFSQQNSNTSAMSFIIGGILFALVPITLGLVGMMAFGSGMEIKDASTAQLAWMQTNLGMAALLAFGFIVLNASANALDSSGNAFGAIVAHDWLKDETKSVWASRLAIVAIATVGWGISVLNLDITYIFLTYGVLRVTLFIVTMLAVGTNLLNKTGIFWATVVVAPIALYMNMNEMKLEGALLAFFATPIMALLVSRISR
jgi:urea-proton symporter